MDEQRKKWINKKKKKKKKKFNLQYCVCVESYNLTCSWENYLGKCISGNNRVLIINKLHPRIFLFPDVSVSNQSVSRGTTRFSSLQTSLAVTRYLPSCNLFKCFSFLISNLKAVNKPCFALLQRWTLQLLRIRNNI